MRIESVAEMIDSSYTFQIEIVGKLGEQTIAAISLRLGAFVLVFTIAIDGEVLESNMNGMHGAHDTSLREWFAFALNIQRGSLHPSTDKTRITVYHNLATDRVATRLQPHSSTRWVSFPQPEQRVVDGFRIIRDVRRALDGDSATSTIFEIDGRVERLCSLVKDAPPFVLGQITPVSQLRRPLPIRIL